MPPTEYFHKFYGDTAVNAYTPALMCGYHFFGAEHMVLGTDMPFGADGGDQCIRESLKSVGEMPVSEADKTKILADNAKRLLHLSR